MTVLTVQSATLQDVRSNCTDATLQDDHLTVQSATLQDDHLTLKSDMLPYDCSNFIDIC